MTRFWGGLRVRLTLRALRRDLTRPYELLRTELIAARQRAGVSQRAVAEQLGAHQQLWSKIESGERRIDLVELLAVAAILKLDTAALLNRLRAEVER